MFSPVCVGCGLLGLVLIVFLCLFLLLPLLFLPQLPLKSLPLLPQLLNPPLVNFLLPLPPLQFLLQLLILNNNSHPRPIQIIRNKTIQIPKDLQCSTQNSQPKQRQTQYQINHVKTTIIFDQWNHQQSYHNYVSCYTYNQLHYLRTRVEGHSNVPQHLEEDDVP